jgi:hypothetical protein
MRARLESLTFFGARTVSINDIQVNDVQHSNTHILNFIIDLSNVDLLFLKFVTFGHTFPFDNNTFKR